MRRPISIPTDTTPDGLDAREAEERAPKTRSGAQRDRDRILYSSAFLRLTGITQVSAAEDGHTFHSRLTHSLKVAQFARRLAERLNSPSVRPLAGQAALVVECLDIDAAEAAGLAHDLGHPPFGHLAEAVLHERTREYGGFEGNAQSFRILTRLALRAPRPAGLNLTRRTLNGVLKYPWLRDQDDPRRSKKWGAYQADARSFEFARGDAADDERSLEAHIMDWADDVTYAVHDVDDFFRAGLIPLDRLCSDDKELEGFTTWLSERPDEGFDLGIAEDLFRDLIAVGEGYTGGAEDRIRLRALGSGLITRYIEAVQIENGADGPEWVVDPKLEAEVAVLKQLTWRYVIERPSLAIIQTGHRKVVEGLFEHYLDAAVAEEYRLLPPAYADRIRAAPTDAVKARAVADLVSSLSEPAALSIYRRMEGVIGGSVLDPAGRYV